MIGLKKPIQADFDRLWSGTWFALQHSGICQSSSEPPHFRKTYHFHALARGERWICDLKLNLYRGVCLCKKQRTVLKGCKHSSHYPDAIPDFSLGVGVVTEPAHTMTGIIAQETGEVDRGSLHWRALFMVGLILFGISLLINWLAQKVIHKFRLV